MGHTVAGEGVGVTPEELRRDNYLAWLWVIAVLRERVSGEPAEQNWHKWQMPAYT